MTFECEDCIGMKEHGCFFFSMGATQPGGPRFDKEAKTRALLFHVLRVYEMWELSNWELGDDSAWEHEFILRMQSLAEEVRLGGWNE